MEQIKKQLQKELKEIRKNNGLNQDQLKLSMTSKMMEQGEFVIVTSSLSEKRMELINSLTSKLGTFVSIKAGDFTFSLRFKVADTNKINLVKETQTFTYQVITGYTKMDKAIKESVTVEIDVYVEGMAEGTEEKQDEEVEVITNPESPIVSYIEEGEYAGCIEINYGYVASL